ncbi:MAG: Holliday junction branch migration protein RuvA [Bacteroidales bacterium]|nr:Holliday junction branch migration protein RuvA [Bacteroidales bacterium]
MYEYIIGQLIELTPSYIIVENNGIGWYINISLNTYSQLEGQKDCKIYLHQVIREDANILFGFFEKSEREIFRMLIEVSGVGPNTARVILSSMSPQELQEAISREDSKLISKVKGIGPKTAQRIVIDLKDKIAKAELGDLPNSISLGVNAYKEEAISALMILGYQKALAEKAIDSALKVNPSLSTEELIKIALKSV